MKKPRNEEDAGWGEYISKIISDGTHEAYNQAMETMGHVVIARDGYVIKVFADGKEEIIQKI